MSDRGHPCRNSRAWHILSRVLLLMILILADDRMAETQLRQRGENLRRSRISMRNSHDTESKALVRSTLNNMHDILRAWSSLATTCTNMKLSCM
jgi:pantothenate kinase